jgi:DNA-binding MarR family transcriptional regulator
MVEPDKASDLVPSDLTLRVRELVVAAERYRLRKARAVSGLGNSELSALGSITVDGPSTPTEIARRLQLTTPSVTELIDRLERADLVRRAPHATDRRKVLVDLTDAGKEVVGDAHEEFGTVVDKSAAAMSPGEQAAMISFLAVTAAALDDMG